MYKQVHRVLRVDSLSSDTFKLSMERKGFKFRSGQCVNLGLPATGVNREYSTYSGENESNLEFLIRQVDDGEVSSAMKRLKPGDGVEIDGAYGLFTLPISSPETLDYVFVATGTGIAPFHSFIRTFQKLEYVLLHGTRLSNENYESSHYISDRYVQCVSGNGGGSFHGRVTDYLNQFPQGREKNYYLCGNRNMINDVYDILREQEVSGSNIITEVFF